MKFLLSILIGLFFTMLAVLRSKWFFDLSVINLFSVEYLWTIDISFIKDSINKLLLIPDLIFNQTKTWLKNSLPENYFFSYNFINAYIVWLFYFTFSVIVILLTNIFSFYRDKMYLLWLIISSYLLILFLL